MDKLDKLDKKNDNIYGNACVVIDDEMVHDFIIWVCFLGAIIIWGFYL
jgi:hypothetical protein